MYSVCKHIAWENQSCLRDDSPSPVMLHENSGCSTNGYIRLMEAGVLVTTNSPIQHDELG